MMGTITMTPAPEFKIVESDLFKEQKKHLPKEVLKSLDKALSNIKKEPYNAPHTMSVFGEPTPEELRRWMGYTKLGTIDCVMEYLRDKGCLNRKGLKFAHAFWERYIKK